MDRLHPISGSNKPAYFVLTSLFEEEICIRAKEYAPNTLNEYSSEIRSYFVRLISYSIPLMAFKGELIIIII